MKAPRFGYGTTKRRLARTSARNQEVIITSLAHLTGKILLTMVLALLLTATAMAKTNVKVLAKGALLKDGKTGYAQATAAKPKTLSVMVQTTPAVKVKIQYSVICTKGGTNNTDGANSSTTPLSGSLSVTSPATTKLKLPFTSPTSCSLTVYTTLPKKGPKETLEILGT